MTAIRPIVKHAFKVDELVEQFRNVDVPDKVLMHGTPEEVNEKFDDAYLVGEARNRLLLIEDQLRNISEDHVEDWKIYSRDERQLKRFISKWT